MDNGLPMLRGKEPQEIVVDYCEVLSHYNARDYFRLDNKLREIERKYRIELCAYNILRPARYLFSLDEQACECMDFLQKLFLCIGLTKMYQGKFCL